MSAIGVTPFKRHALHAWVPDSRSRHVSLSRCGDGEFTYLYLLLVGLILSLIPGLSRSVPVGRFSLSRTLFSRSRSTLSLSHYPPALYRPRPSHQTCKLRSEVHNQHLASGPKIGRLGRLHGRVERLHLPPIAARVQEGGERLSRARRLALEDLQLLACHPLREPVSGQLRALRIAARQADLVGGMSRAEGGIVGGRGVLTTPTLADATTAAATLVRRWWRRPWLEPRRWRWSPDRGSPGC